jgi:hypothetical protein
MDDPWRERLWLAETGEYAGEESRLKSRLQPGLAAPQGRPIDNLPYKAQNAPRLLLWTFHRKVC